MKNFNLNKIKDETLTGCLKGMMSGIIILLVAITCLCSCKTKEFVYLEKTDTLLVHKTDTVKQTHIKVERYDSIVHDSVIVLLGDSGKPKEIHHWHTEFVKDYRNDSVDKYKSECDSLRQKLKNTEAKKEVVTKTDYGGWLAFAGLLVLIAGIVVLVRIFHKQ